MFATIRDNHVARWLGILSLVAAPSFLGCEEHASVGDNQPSDQGQQQPQGQQQGQLGQQGEGQQGQGQQGQAQQGQGQQGQGQYALGGGPGQPSGMQGGQGQQGGSEGQLAQGGQPQGQQGFQQGQQGQQGYQGQQQPYQAQQQPYQGQQGQLAQGGQQGMQGQQGGLGSQGQLGAQGGQMGQGGGQGGQPFTQGVVRGTVQNVGLQQGLVAIQSGGNVVTLHATPSELANLNPGDTVALQYASYGGQPWVMPSGAQGTASYGSTAQLTGTVDAVDQNAGIIAVRGTRLRAHPQQVQNVVPGQYVTVTYANVQSTPWVAQIRPAQQGATASAGQQQGGGAAT